MEKGALTRWQQFYTNDPKLAEIPPSVCANRAAGIFAGKNCRIILDLGCGTGRDTVQFTGDGVKVIGLDAARAGLLLARQGGASKDAPDWVESDSRSVPFSNSSFDGVYCFGLLHEFVGETAKADVVRIMSEVHRVLKPSGVAVIAVSAGDPEKGLPHVQNFSESMFDNATSKFHCVEKNLYDDLGCTGRTDYKVWFGHFVNR